MEPRVPLALRACSRPPTSLPARDLSLVRIAYQPHVPINILSTSLSGHLPHRPPRTHLDRLLYHQPPSVLFFILFSIKVDQLGDHQYHFLVEDEVWQVAEAAD
jgi:hypothetical protein